AAKLEYISSSGLRLLLLLKKQCPDFRIINVSRDVDEILRMTGFDTLLTIERALREISVEGCPCIGRGQYGEAYRLDRDSIVKLFAPNAATVDSLKIERQKAQDAFLLGVPTAISYDVVRCGQRLGLIFELVDAKSVREIVAADPSRLEELIPKCAALARNIHSLTPAPGVFPQMAEIYHSRIDALDDLFTQSELDLLHKMTDSIPVRNTFLHGDFHQGNIMVQGDNLLLIDMADAATGNPFYEVMGTYMLGVRLVQKLPPAMSKEIGGWDAPVVYKAWKIFQKDYLINSDIVAAYSELRYLTFWKIFSLTGDFLSSEVQRIKKDFLPKVNDYIEHYETFLRQDF
ncbi:MAG: phosphotransferase, partial [Synergistaceae bacterium]|nr:phosphotransferase [Synergistaceae bacterium]